MAVGPRAATHIARILMDDVAAQQRYGSLRDEMARAQDKMASFLSEELGNTPDSDDTDYLVREIDFALEDASSPFSSSPIRATGREIAGRMSLRRNRRRR